MANELTKRVNTLPDTLEDLTRFVLIGREKMVAVRAEIRAINKVETAVGVREQKKEEANSLAGALLDAEVRIGEILKKIEPSHGGSIEGKKGGSKATLPQGITHKQSHFFQTMADHKDIVAAVKKDADAADDLPTRTEVLRRIKQETQKEEHAETVKRSNARIDGKYDVIVIDPPWPMEKIDRDCTPEQTGFDYPTMTIDEIKGIKIPSGPECHLFLWTTQRFLRDSFDIMESWGFSFIFNMVWHKNGGFQPFNLPQYNCEFCMYGRKGTPHFSTTKDFFTCFSAKRGKHSEKPEEFYDIIRRVTYGKRIDMFNRREITGFDVWGNQA